MRIRTKRRRLLLLLKIVIVFSFISIFYLIIRSITQKNVIQIIIRPAPKIYVVESEIDAFNIWENISNADLLSQKPGTLIGINSHCNDGLYMQWRTNITNIINVSDALTKLVDMPLQIIYPAVAGLFSKVMCVYPWWRPTSDIYLHHTNYLGIRDESLCLCTLGTNTSSFNESSCRIVHGGPETIVSAGDCRSIGERWETMTMQEIYAQTGLPDTSDTENTMVIVDLDFFTIDKERKFPKKDVVERIESNINGILCPRSSLDEIIIDAWFQKVLNELTMSVDDHLNLLDRYSLPLCSTKKISIITRLKSLLTTTERLSKSERKYLLRHGLCVLSPSNGYWQHNSLSLVICSGTLHTDTFGLSHTAGHNEVTLQMEKLTNFLKQSVTKPRLITIVRSTRLGLVSPNSQVMLETQLLGHLESLYKINDTDVVYDSNLLGGVIGWSKRQQSSG